MYQTRRSSETDHIGRLVRANEQSRWTDPETGYIRRQIAPAPGSDIPLDVVYIELPAGASVTFAARNYASVRQLIWMSDGCLTFIEGKLVHTLNAGDCLELGPPADCTFEMIRAFPVAMSSSCSGWDVSCGQIGTGHE